MTESMKERIARAIWAVDTPSPHESERFEDDKDTYLELADAALAAMEGKAGELHPWARELPEFNRAFAAAHKHHGFSESVMAGLNAMVRAARTGHYETEVAHEAAIRAARG